MKIANPYAVNMLVFLALALSSGRIFAQEIKCNSEQERQIRQQLSLAEVYETQEAWREASDMYRLVALTSCPNLSDLGRAGLERTLATENSLRTRLKSGLSELLGSILIGAIEVLGIGLLVLLVIRFFLHQIVSTDRWTILPFLDETGKNGGEAFADGVVTNVHDIRLLFGQQNHAMIGGSFINDLPTMSIIKHRESLLAALGGLDRLDVSGLGLPVGSLLANIIRWLDLRGKRIFGTLHRSGDNLEVTARLEEGRDGKCTFVWHCEVPIVDTNDFEGSFVLLQKKLAYQLLLDTVQESWGTRFASALQAFADGYQALLSYFYTGARETNWLEAAQRRFIEAVQIDPTYKQAILQLAVTELNLDHNDASVRLLQSLDGQNEFIPEVAYNLGVAWYQKRFDIGYEKSEVQFRKALEFIEASTKIETRHELTALSYCGLISVNAQRIRSSQSPNEQLQEVVNEFYRKATENKDRLPNQVLAQIQYVMGLWSLNSNQLEVASNFVRDAISLNPFHWRAYTLQGQIGLKSKNYSQAISEFKRAIALAPNFEFAYYQLGRAYSQERGPNWSDNAIAALSKAPSISKSYLEHGKILAEEYGHYQEALQLFESTLAMKSQQADALAAIAWYIAEGDMLVGSHVERALEAAFKAVRLTAEKDWHKLDVLGRILLETDDLEQAETVLKKALRLELQAPQVNYHLAELYVRMNNQDAARHHLIAIFEYPGRSVWRHKAEILMREVEQSLKNGN